MDFVSERIRNMIPYTAGEQVEYIIKLNTNENPYPPTPKIPELLKNLDITKLKLYPDQHCKAVKAAVSKVYKVTPDMVFAGNGSDEILALLHHAYFDGENEKIAYPDVTYSFYPVYSELFKVKAVVVPVKDDFTIDLNDYDNLDVKGYMFANPNAPTGIAISLAVMEEFIKRHPDKLVILDEAYIDFCSESAVELTKTYDNLLVIRTLSKGYSLAGLRCGFAVGCRKLIEGLNIIKDSFNNYPLDYLAQIIAAEAIADVEYYKSVNKKVQLTRDRISGELKGIGFTVLPSSSNFLFVTHRDKKAEDLYKQLKAEKILVRHWNKKRIDNYLRITVGTDADMDYLVKRLKALTDA